MLSLSEESGETGESKESTCIAGSPDGQGRTSWLSGGSMSVVWTCLSVSMSQCCVLFFLTSPSSSSDRVLFVPAPVVRAGVVGDGEDTDNMGTIGEGDCENGGE